MVKKEVYQKVESDCMMAESEIRELKFTINNAKLKLKEAMEILDSVNSKIE